MREIKGKIKCALKGKKKIKMKDIMKDKIKDQNDIIRDIIKDTMKGKTISVLAGITIMLAAVSVSGCAGSEVALPEDTKVPYETIVTESSGEIPGIGSGGNSGRSSGGSSKKVELDEIQIEKDARVSYLGPEGTYTQEAALLFFGEEAALLAQDTVDTAIQVLKEGNADYAVIPQENTIGGAVTNYVDALIRQENVYVVGEVILPISQTLMGVPGTKLSDIKVVCSHAQGIRQTETWRSENIPGAVTKEMDSTAAAANYVAEANDKTIAAIAAPGAAVLYGLEVLAENVQISMGNKTRFYVLSREQQEGAFSNALFVADCRAEQIDDIIVRMHDEGLEMVAIHDRPEGSSLGSYHFVI